jgi:hypothetical protein
MSGTFSVRLDGTLTNELHVEKFGSSVNKLIPQIGQGVYSTVARIGTGLAGETISSGDISPAGYVYLKNLDTGVSVFYGPRNGANMEVVGRLKPGGEAWFKIHTASGSLKMKTDTDDPSKVPDTLVQIKIFEA